jgi:PIN domain nuclease of toxin-antitoxin system
LPGYVDALGYRLLPINLSHALAVEHVPLHHRDPFDRLLVAQAQLEQATLVSADPVFARYDVPLLWT